MKKRFFSKLAVLIMMVAAFMGGVSLQHTISTKATITDFDCEYGFIGTFSLENNTLYGWYTDCISRIGFLSVCSFSTNEVRVEVSCVAGCDIFGSDWRNLKSDLLCCVDCDCNS